MTDKDIQEAKPVSKILKILRELNVAELPSGTTVSVAYLSWGMLQEIEEALVTVSSDTKAHKFTESVIAQMLRGNELKDFRAFSAEDQSRLIEIAVEKWGCEETFNQIADLNDPEERFFQAVQKQEEELTTILSETAKAFTATLAGNLVPSNGFQNALASVVKSLIEPSTATLRLSETIKSLNVPAIQQMGDILRLQAPIFSIAEEIAKMANDSLLPGQNALKESLGGAVTSYQELMRDILPVEKFSALPDSVRYYPTIEMRNTSIISGYILTDHLSQSREEIITPDCSELLDWLESLDPSFPNMLLGAEQTIHSQNPDHCRHFASSHRELSTHILHLLAPNEQVKRWTKDPNYFDKDDKPTRKARLKYIARNHSNETFKDFVIKDFENQMALLNADEHRRTQEYTDQELIALHKRFLSMLGFLKEIVSSCS